MTKNSKNAARRHKTLNHHNNVHIVIGSEKSNVTSAEWANLMETAAHLIPEKFNSTTATAISAFWAAKAADKMTEQYGTESHFGFTTRPNVVIDEITEIFNNIDKLIFFTATNGDNEKFNIDKLIKSLVGNEASCLVSVQDMERLNWLFKRVEFFCTNLLRDHGYSNIPEFYNVVALGEVGISRWLVPAEHITVLFNTTEDTIIVEDNDLKIYFAKVVPTTSEICKSDNYSVVSVYDAIRNIMADYFYNKSV